LTQERLQRALARAGIGSRRQCEKLIAQGRVEVDGRAATLGDKLDPSSLVKVDGVRINLDPTVRYYALHKPAGVTTTMGDPHAKRDIREFIPAGPRVFPVGRLDRDTEGLILLTNDGDLAHRIMHPSYGVEREYLAEVSGKPSRTQLSALRAGVDLEDGRARVSSVRVTARDRERVALRVVMTEGRKREVRRLLAAVGLPVKRLVRLRVGPVRLGRLGPGQTRELSPQEIRDLSLIVEL
jgi:pseudouridine synthase